MLSGCAKRYIVCIMLILTFNLILVSCSNKIQVSQDIDISKIINSKYIDKSLEVILPSTKVSDLFSDKPIDNIKELYGIDFYKTDDFVFAISKDANDVKTIIISKYSSEEEAISNMPEYERFLSSLILQYKAYNPDASYKLENSIIEVKDNYVIFICSDENDEIYKYIIN